MGRMDNNKLYFTSEEIVSITKKYVLLYKNRQNSITTKNKTKKIDQLEKKGAFGEQY